MLGLILGSFASAVSARLQEHIAWIFDSRSKKKVFAKSSCPQCGAQLRAKDLVPLISWMSRQGKCAYCKKTISWIYPALEIATGLSAVLLYVFLGWTPAFWFAISLLPFLHAWAVFRFRNHSTLSKESMIPFLLLIFVIISICMGELNIRLVIPFSVVAAYFFLESALSIKPGLLSDRRRESLFKGYTFLLAFFYLYFLIIPMGFNPIFKV